MSITPNPHFDMLLRYGKAREGAFRRVLTEVEVVTIEHKSEPHAIEHGAVFIEYADHGVPTGLAITTADFYGIEITLDRWVLIRTEDLKALCREAIREGRATKGGWEGRSEGVRLPLIRLLR